MTRFLLLTLVSLFIILSCMKRVSPPPVPSSLNDIYLANSTWLLDSLEYEGKKYNAKKWLQLEFSKTELENIPQYYYSIKIIKDSILDRMQKCDLKMESLRDNDFYIVHKKKKVAYAIVSDTSAVIKVHFAWRETKYFPFTRLGGNRDYKIDLLFDVNVYEYCFIRDDTTNAEGINYLPYCFKDLCFDRTSDIKLTPYKLVIMDTKDRTRPKLIFKKVKKYGNG